MPLRCGASRAALVIRNAHSNALRVWLPSRRAFHPAHPLRDEAKSKTHYETLKVPTTATPAQIKKSFYALSKTHHPDHNPSDPTSGRRFMLISEAYSVLSSSEKRAIYDRDVMRLHHIHFPSHAGHPRGSYSSTGPAGGRPASGLSRRRGSFVGPSPSFFRSGGWGSQASKRRAAHEESTGGAASSAGSAPGGGGGGGARAGGMGTGQDHYAQYVRDEDLPHFDSEAHERTQQRAEERRLRKMMDAQGFGGLVPGMGMAGSFFLISAVLATGLLFPFMVYEATRTTSKKGKGNDTVVR